MLVEKRDGSFEPVQYDKITERIENVRINIDPPLQNVESDKVAQKTIQGVIDKITTVQLDILAAEISASMSTIHIEYSDLAARIAVSNLHKETPSKFSDCIYQLYDYINPKNDKFSPLVSDELYMIVYNNKDVLDSAIVHSRDFIFDYFGFKTLDKTYLKKLDGKSCERPQYMFMRVALGIHGYDIAAAIETYNLMSQKYFIHATPTLYNAGTQVAQMSSCFLLTMKDDSIEGIYDTLKQTALISKAAGGVGLSIHNIRANQSYIAGNGGVSSGIVPMLRVFDTTARYVDQSSKRKGAFAIYLEMWHADIFDFLDLKKNTGKEESRTRDLFLAAWVSDLFMQRVEKDEMWSLFCPNEAAGLCDVYGDKFVQLYEKYEKENRQRKKVKARDLWSKVIDSQIETGVPYILYKDSCNRKSNQKNLGTLRSSNLCCEILEYTSPDEVAVCNLASIALPTMLSGKNFDHDKLFDVVQVVTKNLNKIIDRNFYPIPEAKNSNLKHRPIGIGVQGLADVFIEMGLPFESQEARQLNEEIFETIYYAFVWASVDLAKNEGQYQTFEGSPADQGLLQYRLWTGHAAKNGRWNWDDLEKRVARYGMRNSLGVALMPTATTSQILGFNEACEPYTSNVYSRRTLAGEFVIVNRHLFRDLSELGLWSPEMKNEIVKHKGSIQNISGLPDHLKRLYKTVWEIKQKVVIDMAADRGKYICQSQSMNIFMENPNFQKLNSMHFYGWKSGLKTGMYYFRTRPAADAIQFTVDQKTSNKPEDSKEEKNVCRMEEGCIVCSS